MHGYIYFDVLRKSWHNSTPRSAESLTTTKFSTICLVCTTTSWSPYHSLNGFKITNWSKTPTISIIYFQGCHRWGKINPVSGIFKFCLEEAILLCFKKCFVFYLCDPFDELNMYFCDQIHFRKFLQTESCFLDKWKLKTFTRVSWLQ